MHLNYSNLVIGFAVASEVNVIQLNRNCAIRTGESFIMTAVVDERRSRHHQLTRTTISALFINYYKI